VFLPPHTAQEVTEGDRPRRSQALPSRFYAAIAAVALFSLANSSDAFLILQAHMTGVSMAMLPALRAAHQVTKSLFSTRAGALSDRIDRRVLLIAGWSSYAIIYAVFPFARSLPVFILLFVLYAIPFTLSEGGDFGVAASFFACHVQSTTQVDLCQRRRPDS
jgi:sugar phosphate permease